MRLSFLLAIATVLLNGCGTARRNDGQHSSQSLPLQAPYVRISTNDPNIIELQIALRKFVPNRGHGPAVWLAGVSHIGESNYYSALQKQLDAQSLVLFEGIGSGAGETSPQERRMKATPKPADSDEQRSPASLQSEMASSLGLVFQLEAIDYSSPNFRNSDLSVKQLRDTISARPAEPGQAGASQSFETLLQMMQGDSFFDAILRMLMRFLGSSPKLQALSKLALMQSIEEMSGDPSQLQGLPPEVKELLEVLVQKRNQKVLDDLKAELKKKTRPDSIAIFYGTGHMPDMGVQLARQLKYKPVEDVWLTAFSVDLKRASVSPAEVQFIRSLIKQEIKQLQTKK